MCSDDQTSIPLEELLPTARLTYPEDHLESCLARFQTYKLLAPVSIPKDLPASQFFSRFSDILNTYLNENSWFFPPGATSGSDFERKPFRLLVPVRIQGEMYLHRPRKTMVLNTFNAAKLGKSPFGSTIPNALDPDSKAIILFACMSLLYAICSSPCLTCHIGNKAPVGGNLRGWVDRFPGGRELAVGPHRCAGHRFYEGWQAGEFGIQQDTEIDCFSNCTVGGIPAIRLWELKSWAGR